MHGWISNAEIWNYGPQFLDIATQYDELRYHLLPYIYSSAWGVTSKGETLMRALPLEFSSDPGSRSVSDQFMFGPAFLVSPVDTEGAKQRTVYLPGGSGWIDFWTGKHENGGRSVTAEAQLDRIPIFVREGSIVPYGPRVESAAGKPDPIDLRVYAGANGDFSLYEDEGDNYDYERGAHSVIPIHWDDKSATLTIGARDGSFPGMLEHRTFHVVVVRDGQGTGIASSPESDATIAYEGKSVSAHVQPRM